MRVLIRQEVGSSTPNREYWSPRALTDGVAELRRRPSSLVLRRLPKGMQYDRAMQAGIARESIVSVGMGWNLHLKSERREAWCPRELYGALWNDICIRRQQH